MDTAEHTDVRNVGAEWLSNRPLTSWNWKTFCAIKDGANILSTQHYPPLLSEQSIPCLNVLHTIVFATTRLLENFTLVQRTSYQESIRCIKWRISSMPSKRKSSVTYAMSPMTFSIQITSWCSLTWLTSILKEASVRAKGRHQTLREGCKTYRSSHSEIALYRKILCHRQR